MSFAVGYNLTTNAKPLTCKEKLDDSHFRQNDNNAALALQPQASILMRSSSIRHSV
jgi:hypothetical protein